MWVSDSEVGINGAERKANKKRLTDPTVHVVAAFSDDRRSFHKLYTDNTLKGKSYAVQEFLSLNENQLKAKS